MANKGTGFDAWDNEALVVKGRKKGVAFQVTGCERLEVHSSRLAGATEQLGSAIAGLTGRDLILKYTRVPSVPDWQLAKLMDFEVQEIASQAGGDLAADYNLLPLADEMTGEDTVLLALAKTETLQATDQLVQSIKGRVEAYTPNAVALYNAYLMAGPVTEDDTVLLGWIGERSVDIALVRGPNLLFARNVSGGLQILDGAISQTFNVREERARKIRGELLNLDPRSRGSYGSSQEERVAHSVQSVAGQLQAALRSTLAFCQSQTNIQELSLKRALLCGPGARIRGMDAFLADGLGCSCEVWDPVPSLDLSQCSPEAQSVAMSAGPDLVVALGLAMAPCFDDLYSIEILPESVKKKRKFLERTSLNIAAGAVAAGYLGWFAYDSKNEYERLQKEARVATGFLKRTDGVNSRTARLVDANTTNADRFGQLNEMTVPLYGTIELLREVQTALPPDLWLTQIKSHRGTPTWEKDKPAPGNKPAGQVSRRKKKKVRTYLIVKGKGVPLTSNDLSVTYRKFKETLKSRNVPIVLDTTSPVGGFQFELTIDYLANRDEQAE